MSRIGFATVPDDLPVKNNLVRTTYVNPEMHRGFASLSGRVHSASHLPTRTRELALLRVIAVVGSDYEWQQHSRAARHAGVSDAELTQLKAGDLAAFQGSERSAISFAEAVERGTVDDAIFAEAGHWFSQVQLSDLALLAGFYGLASRYALAFAIDLEPD